ncbi:MAG: DUF3617 family protein [Rhizobiales bacterium]|jgi:hypothetical protein|nr:DUF3617 family protein [Hyphomicrobiales bacterium]
MHRQLAIAVCGFVIATAASATEMPMRKAGLWDLKMNFDSRGVPPQSIQQCVDAATDKLMNSNFGGMSKGSCSTHDVKTAGSTITVDSVCKFGEATTTSHAVVTGSFDRAYTVRVTSTRKGGPAIPGMTPGQAVNMTIEAKYLGPCKAGQKPGDMIMANGFKMNVLNMRSAHGTPPRH